MPCRNHKANSPTPSASSQKQGDLSGQSRPKTKKKQEKDIKNSSSKRVFFPLSLRPLPTPDAGRHRLRNSVSRKIRKHETQTKETRKFRSDSGVCCELHGNETRSKQNWIVVQNRNTERRKKTTTKKKRIPAGREK